MDLHVAFSIIDEHENELGEMSGSELYAGSYLNKGTEYESMKGVHGETAPFMSGFCTIFSHGLLKSILETDWTHTVLYSDYGTSSDDANGGKWVKYAQEKRGLRVDIRFERMGERVEEIEESEEFQE